ncbi:MAG: esterase [Nitriliruptorales bacterium]|nr:esterase [Nitriliruptorales bacterium]
MVDVKPGCEPWSCDGTGANADIGVLLLHGFTGSPASMRPLAHDLAARGFAVELPLLSGHGTHIQNVMNTTWQDLARDTVTAFERLRGRTSRHIVLGMSVGAAMGTRLAQTRSADVAGLVLINPYLGTDHPLGKLLPLLRFVLPTYKGVINDIAKPDMDELGYDRLPVRALHSISLMQRDVIAALPSMTVPTLLMTSREDHVTGTFSARLIDEKIGANDFEHVWLERSYHVATLDHDYPIILEESAKFVERVGHAAR